MKKCLRFIIVSLICSSPFLLTAQDVFFESMDIFFKKHVRNGLVDYELIHAQPSALEQLVLDLSTYKIPSDQPDLEKAFWINAYNLLTIYKISKHYPTPSPLQVNSFFEAKDFLVAGEQMSLSGLEKEKLLLKFKDARLHFVLVCAAIDCPKIKKGAFLPKDLDLQIDKRLKVVLNDPTFIKIDRSENEIQLSEIFRWYYSDFEPAGGLRPFLNLYRKVRLPEDYKIKYYDYDWSLNDVKNNRITPFRASALLNPGIAEIKVFNALYTQTMNDGFDKVNSRSSYFSSFTQVLYGWKNDINIGFDLVYKSNVTNDFHNASPFKTLAFQKDWTYNKLDCINGNHNISTNASCSIGGMSSTVDTFRNADGQVLKTHQAIGLAHFGPKIKINPVKKWSNISLQQTLYIPINKSVDGSTVSFTQLFYDQPIGSKSQLFIEGSIWAIVHPNVQAFPFVKAFYSHFPVKRWTIYGMTGNLIEYGVGTKYFILPKIEIELLYTYYLPWERFLQDRRAMTFNIGIRYQG